jgi:hypothetical protein
MGPKGLFRGPASRFGRRVPVLMFAPLAVISSGLCSLLERTEQQRVRYCIRCWYGPAVDLPSTCRLPAIDDEHTGLLCSCFFLGNDV